MPSIESPGKNPGEKTNVGISSIPQDLLIMETGFMTDKGNDTWVFYKTEHGVWQKKRMDTAEDWDHLSKKIWHEIPVEVFDKLGCQSKDN